MQETAFILCFIGTIVSYIYYQLQREKVLHNWCRIMAGDTAFRWWDGKKLRQQSMEHAFAMMVYPIIDDMYMQPEGQPFARRANIACVAFYLLLIATILLGILPID